MTLRWTLACACLVACGGSRRDPSTPAGDHDDGSGLLAQASTSLRIGNTGSDELGAVPSPGPSEGAFGGTSYAHWTAPAWSYANTPRPPRYVVTDTGLDASIEGTVTWPGAMPAMLKTPCGPLPAIRLGAQRGVRGVIVFIEHITTGRGLGGTDRAQLGGVIAKHGCALGPTAQLAVPVPSSVGIHGDAQPTRVRITPPGGPATTFELQEGGLVTAEIKPGVTRIDGEDGKLAAAWVIGIESPYYSVTDDFGRFRIEQLAPGTYDVTFWQPPIATIKADGSFAYGPPIVVHRSIHVVAKQTANVTIALPPR
ncbi:MAG: carboxypeptidase-like regulatory domain-containing protein [Kofleriaceae bacterium]